MKRLAFLLLVVVIVVGVGFYRGWFTVNPEKIEQDEKRAKEEVRELLDEVKAKSAERAKQERRSELPPPRSAPE
jgi:Tfp pilus assembly protein PilO